MASATAIGTGLTGSLGATAIDVATQVKDMDTAWLAAHSPYFRHQVNALARQAQVKNATQILKQAKEATAQRVSAAVLSDPVAIAGSTVGALGIVCCSVRSPIDCAVASSRVGCAVV